MEDALKDSLVEQFRSNAAGVDAGIVLEDVRTGFLWEDQPLRLAEVIASKPVTGEVRND